MVVLPTPLGPSTAINTAVQAPVGAVGVRRADALPGDDHRGGAALAAGVVQRARPAGRVGPDLVAVVEAVPVEGVGDLPVEDVADQELAVGVPGLGCAGGEDEVGADGGVAIGEDVDQGAGVAAGQRQGVVGEPDRHQLDAVGQGGGGGGDRPHRLLGRGEPAVGLHAPAEARPHRIHVGRRPWTKSGSPAKRVSRFFAGTPL
ncbi:hypothetical protein [Micromonospora carbonacea]|nr:hypothetical protein [Micromonospora carbonacea]